MKPISQKKFMELLETKRSILLASKFYHTPAEVECIKKAIKKFVKEADFKSVKVNGEVRTCEKKQTKALQFSNGSWIYYRPFSECYMEEFNDNTIIYRVDKDCVMVYYIK